VFHHAVAEECSEKTRQIPGPLVGVGREACSALTRQGTRAHRLSGGSRAVKYSTTLLLYSMRYTLAMLSVARRLCESGGGPAVLVVPALRGPCCACITRGFRAQNAKMRDRKPPRNTDRHQST
jgi:hypothetical protein